MAHSRLSVSSFARSTAVSAPLFTSTQLGSLRSEPLSRMNLISHTQVCVYNCTTHSACGTAVLSVSVQSYNSRQQHCIVQLTIADGTELSTDSATTAQLSTGTVHHTPTGAGLVNEYVQRAPRCTACVPNAVYCFEFVIGGRDDDTAVAHSTVRGQRPTKSCYGRTGGTLSWVIASTKFNLKSSLQTETIVQARVSPIKYRSFILLEAVSPKYNRTASV